jgi:RNA polymerase sigma factor (sigma-70 family)
VSAELEPDEVFASFFLKNYGRLVKAITLWTGDRQLAEDIAQEVMETLAMYRYELPELLMFKIARQRLSRSYVPIQYHALDDAMLNSDTRLSIEGADSVIESSLSSNVELIAALRSLPTRQREVIVLEVACELSQEQVAEILGISKSAVKTHKTRGLNRLATLMASQPEASGPSAEQPVGGA